MSETASLDREAPGANVSDLLAQAMRRVETSVGAPRANSTGVEPGQDAAECLSPLWDAVQRALGGQEPAVVARSPHARRVLDGLRRSFVDVVRAAPEEDLDVREVVGVLEAIERVQAAIDRDVAASFKERLEGPGGLDLVIEVAHDLRSPLTSILYLAETLRAGQSGPLKPLQERQLALIYSAAFELSSLANDLTELARGGEQLLERQPIAFSIANVLNSVRDIVQPIAEERALEIRLVRDAVDRRLGQPAALGRVLLNLVTNALKFSEHGFVEVSAHESSPGRTEFSVRDTGPGMSTEMVSQLFEPFHPGAATRERGFSSSGLGLAICRQLVAAMGGQLRVKSAPERGSCFYFELPLPTDDSEQMLE